MDNKNELLMMKIFALLVITLLFLQRLQIEELQKITLENDKTIQQIKQKLKD